MEGRYRVFTLAHTPHIAQPLWTSNSHIGVVHLSQLLNIRLEPIHLPVPAEGLCVNDGAWFWHSARQLRADSALPPELQGQPKASAQGLLCFCLSTKAVLSMPLVCQILRMLRLVRDVQTPVNTSLPSWFLSFRLVYCFLQLLSNTLGLCEVNQSPVIVFDKCLQEKSFSLWLSSEPNKNAALQVGSSREPPDTSNNDNFLGMRLSKELWPSSALLSGCQMTCFHYKYELLICKTITNLETGDEPGAS